MVMGGPETETADCCTWQNVIRRAFFIFHFKISFHFSVSGFFIMSCPIIECDSGCLVQFLNVQLHLGMERG